jgi:uncharacterized protein YfaS (alpha-2-macroglobulin family)
MKYSHCYPGYFVPNQTWYFMFENNIELDVFDPKKDVVITPEIKCKITATEKSIRIEPESKGQTKYTIKFKTSIKDVFGQNLNKETDVDINISKATPMFQSMGFVFFIIF